MTAILLIVELYFVLATIRPFSDILYQLPKCLMSFVLFRWLKLTICFHLIYKIECKH